jgi:hypothetical protein
MVKWDDVNNPVSGHNEPPIGVLQSLARGFDRVTAQPLLLLPPVLLDLFFWFGPRLRLPWAWLDPRRNGGLPPGLGEQSVRNLQAALQELAARLNIFVILGAPPLGLPTLMARRMPLEAPLGPAPALELQNPLLLIPLLLLLLASGQLMGAQFHLWMARHVAGAQTAGRALRASLRLVGIALLAYLTLSVLSFALLVVLGLLISLPAIVGAVVFFVAFTMGFWLVIYLAFTPHGIARYGLSIPRAALESVLLVRWNLPGVVGLFGVGFGITWLTNQVWSMPYEHSWYSGLAIVGHALISTTLLAASYVFYQGRREWLLAMQERARRAEEGFGQRQF